MSGVRYHSKKSNIIPGAIGINLPLETVDEFGNPIDIRQYDPKDYRGAFAFNDGDSVMYYSTGQEWVTMDRVPILRPAPRLPTNSVERSQLRLTPFTVGKGFEEVVQTRAAFEIYLTADLSIKYKTRFDFTFVGTVESVDFLTKAYLKNIITGDEYQCGYFLLKNNQVYSLIDIPNDVKNIITNPDFSIPNHQLRFEGSNNYYAFTNPTYINIWDGATGYTVNYFDELGIAFLGSSTEQAIPNIASIDLPTKDKIGFDYGQAYYWRGKYFGGVISGTDVDELYESNWSLTTKQEYPKAIEDPFAITRSGIRTDRLEISPFESAWSELFTHNKTIFEIYEDINEDPVATIEKTNCGAVSDPILQKRCQAVLKFEEDESTKDFTVFDITSNQDVILEDGKTYSWRAKYTTSNNSSEWTSFRTFIVPEKDMIFRLVFDQPTQNTFTVPVFWNINNVTTPGQGIKIKFDQPLEYIGSGNTNIPYEWNQSFYPLDNTLRYIIQPNTYYEFLFNNLRDNESLLAFRTISGLATPSLIVTIEYFDQTRISTENVQYFTLMRFKDQSVESIDPKYSDNGIGEDEQDEKFISFFEEMISFGKNLTLARFSNFSKLIKVSEYLPYTITSMTKMFAGCPIFNQDLSNWDTSNIYMSKTTAWWTDEFNEVFKNTLTFNNNISTWFISDRFDGSLKPSVVCQNMFRNAREFNSNISNWNTSRISFMDNMFYNTYKFNQDLSKWDTSSCRSMSGMFANTYVFNSNLTSWNTLSVQSMASMFYNAREFNSDISGWNVSNVKSFASMFQGSWKFNSDISGWIINTNESDDVNMSSMFYGARSFNKDISTWNVTKVNTMYRMFREAVVFNQPISAWDVSNVTNMSEMFYGAKAFNQDLIDWNVSKVTNFNNMFALAEKFDGSLKDWILVEDLMNPGIPDKTMNSMFYNTKSFTGKDIGTWNMTKVNSASSMFSECTAFKGTGLSNWGSTTKNIKDFSWMFHRCSSFNEPIGNWDVSSATTMQSMFGAATSFNQNLKDWNVSNVTNMESMFNSASVFGKDDPTIIQNWNTENLVNMDYMFAWCTNFNGNLTYSESPKIWDVSKVTSLLYTFYECRSFTGTGLNTWNISNVTSLSHTFVRNYVFNTNIGSWNTSKVTNFTRTFYDTNIGTSINFSNWDVSKGTTFYGMFEYSNMNSNTINNWIFRTDTNIDMRLMFRGNTVFNQDISYKSINNAWNTSRVTSMHGMFASARAFNQDIGNWDTTNVNDMSYMFDNATVFNKSLALWNTAKVTNMRYMFNNAQYYNQPMETGETIETENQWNVSKVINMEYMFANAIRFNQDISNWNTEKVQNFRGMFYNARVFNSNISEWDTGNATNMASMFESSPSVFKQDISGWSYNYVTDLSNYLKGTLLQDYSALPTNTPTILDNLYVRLYDLAKNDAIQSNLVFHGGNNKYTNRPLVIGSTLSTGQEARNYLIVSKGWTIIDGGQL